MCLAPVWLEKKLVQLKNTCPFDTIVEILSTAYIDNKQYLNHLNSLNEKNLTISFIKSYSINGPSTALYKERGNILATVFEQTNNTLNCASNNTFLIEKLFKYVPSSRTEIECSNCGNQNKFNTTIEINADQILDYGLKLGFANFIDDYFSQKILKCKTCQIQCINQNFPFLSFKTILMCYVELGRINNNKSKILF